MDRLIGDLLAYSRLSCNRITLQPVALLVVVETARQQLEAQVQEKQAEIGITTALPVVLAHRPTLTQAIASLLSNAIKFVPSEIRLHVEISIQRIERDRHNWIRFWIVDNGIGIAPGDRERIFHVCERLHGIESYLGTGIGLAIVRKGIEQIGGYVGVESQLGQGSRFWVELPLYER